MLLLLGFAGQDTRTEDMRRAMQPRFGVRAPVVDWRIDSTWADIKVYPMHSYNVKSPWHVIAEGERKISIERLSDGTFIAYWPLGKQEDGSCLVAFTRVPAVRRFLDDLITDVMHGGARKYAPAQPLEQTITGRCK